MEQVKVARHFDAPAERVWEVYTDHARWSEWAGFPKSWIEKPGVPLTNGSGCVRGFGAMGSKTFETIHEFDPPHRMTYSILKGGLPIADHFGEVSFEPDGDGSRIVWQCRFRSRVPLMGLVLQRFITRFFRNALDGLAKHSFPDA